MAEHNTAPVEMGAEMDYPEHEKTYAMFLALSKFGTLGCIVIMVGMAIGFFTAAGFIGGTLAAIILFAVGSYLLK